MKTKFVRMFIILGICVPFLLFFSITVLSGTWPGYSFINEEISVLGSGSSPFQIFANILIFGASGVTMVGFAYAFGEYIKKNYFSDNGSRFLTASGILFVVLGFFPIDRGPSNITDASKLHSLVVLVASSMLLLSIAWYVLAFRKDGRWGILWVIISCLLVLFSLSAGLTLKISPSLLYDGIIERAGFGFVLLWVFLVSINCFLIDQLKTPTENL